VKLRIAIADSAARVVKLSHYPFEHELDFIRTASQWNSIRAVLKMPRVSDSRNDRMFGIDKIVWCPGLDAISVREFKPSVDSGIQDRAHPEVRLRRLRLKRHFSIFSFRAWHFAMIAEAWLTRIIPPEQVAHHVYRHPPYQHHRDHVSQLEFLSQALPTVPFGDFALLSKRGR
jgi:hypothetical protein